MTSPRTTLKHLKKLNQYLATLPLQVQQSACFEWLVAQAFSHILYLPFFSSDNDDASISHRVIWLGSETNLSRAPQNANAPPNSPDAIAYAYKFYILIESTLKTGANQWTQEFAQSLRHCDDFVSRTGAHPNEVYIVLVAPKLYIDTYWSIRQNPRSGFNFILLEVPELAKILETSILAFTMRHLELRRLLNQVPQCIANSSSLRDFRKLLNDWIKGWRQDVLKLEKNAFIGVKSYKVMKEIGRTHIGVSEILRKLQAHPIVLQYFNIIDSKVSVSDVIESLYQQKLGFRLTPTTDGEEIFEPVPALDFKARESRLIKAVEEING